MLYIQASIKSMSFRKFPGGPVVRTRHFDCGGRVWPLVGELRSRMPCGVAKFLKNEKKERKICLLNARFPNVRFLIRTYSLIQNFPICIQWKVSLTLRTARAGCWPVDHTNTVFSECAVTWRKNWQDLLWNSQFVFKTERSSSTLNPQVQENDSVNCQMPEIVEFSNKFDVLYSRENNPWIGGVKYLTSSGAFFPGGFGQEQAL